VRRKENPKKKKRKNKIGGHYVGILRKRKKKGEEIVGMKWPLCWDPKKKKRKKDRWNKMAIVLRILRKRKKKQNKWIGLIIMLG